MTVPAQELQSLTPGAVIELFILDASGISGGSVYRFHPGTNGVATDIVWQGVTYTAFPIKAEGFEITSKGTLPRPTLAASNVNGAIGLLVRDLEDLVGAVVTRKRTLQQFLDAVNFPGGVNATADSTRALADDVYIVERKASENKEVISFELATAVDVHGLKIPSRIIQATVCSWVYKGLECGYAGGLATCNKLADNASGDGGCRQHFAQPAELPFGAFPGTSRVR